MNSYKLEELKVGTSEQFSATVTEESMRHFYELSGDCSPIHMDAEYAAKRGYAGRVVYGMLSASFVSTMAGVYLPGEHCLLHSVESKFIKPVMIGDRLTISAKVAEINTLFSEITVKFDIRNQNGEKVLRGTYKAGLSE